MILLHGADLENTKLNKSILTTVFASGNIDFRDSIPKESIEKYFGSEKEALANFSFFNPIIEKIYLDVLKQETKTLVISFENIENDIQFALIGYNPSKKKYEILSFKRQYLEIDTSKNDGNLIKGPIEAALKKHIVKCELNKNNAITNNIFYSKEDDWYIVDSSRLDVETKNLMMKICSKSIKSSSWTDISIDVCAINIESIENPYYEYVIFTYKYKEYIFDFNFNSSEEFDLKLNGDTENSFYDAFVDVASETLKSEYRQIYEEEAIQKEKDLISSFVEKIYKGRFTVIKNDDGIVFQELGDSNLVSFDKQVHICIDRNENQLVTYEYGYLISDTSIIKRDIDRGILSKPKVYLDFVRDAEDFLNGSCDLENLKNMGNDLLNRLDTIPSHELNSVSFRKMLLSINEKLNEISSIDKAKVSKVIGYIQKIKDIASYDEYNDLLFDAVDDLSDVEYSAIKNKYEEFLDKFKDVPNYSSSTIYRRVFIRKSVLEKLQKINEEQRDLKLLSVLDEVVDKLKTTPGNELGSYLLYKGLNFPIKNDRSIKKIRIMRNSKYRLLFVYGSDLDLDDRIDNFDSIYIFAVTEHKKDSSDLYRAAETKPSKYEVNDFIVYPRNKMVVIPECTTGQYKIASNHTNKPVITFGCAGSGKTTVSIEQYVDIVYSEFGCVSPNSDKLVYLTFHKRLSEKVKKDLAEFKIYGNCFKLDEYFAYVVEEPYIQGKIINENIFINWFKNEYSDEEIQKNKGKKKNKISPLKNKPDKARLLYTYYRGVFKGSRLLFDSQNSHLTMNEFISQMENETYLVREEKEAIYNICLEFDEFAKQNDLLSDNDYALKVIRQASYKLKKTDCIIIDEVQDLTEIEIIATIMTLVEGSQKIYFYGDPHQSINPNVFDGSTINKVYSLLNQITFTESSPLTITYRTNFNLISYLNDLLEKRDKWIGLTKGGLSKIDQPSKIEEFTSWAGYVTNKDLYKKVFETNPNSMIITPSEASRLELLKKYPFIDPARSITIYEAKGMEWDTVIMYNMFTDYESYFLDMISENGKAKKSTIHRMTFNKYYVGCTRSTKSFVIIEENERLFNHEGLIFNELLSSFSEISKEEQINSYILEDNSFEAWYREAVQNLNNENGGTFKNALTHAQRLAKTPEERKLVKELLDGDPETLTQYAFSFLADKEYSLAKNAFIKVYKATKQYEPYIWLTIVLSGIQLREDDLKAFLKHQEIMNQYPELYPNLIKQKEFQKILKKLLIRIEPEGEFNY